MKPLAFSSFLLFLGVLLYGQPGARATPRSASCVPGGTQCNSNGTLQRVCDSKGVWASIVDCAARGLPCVNARCAENENLNRVEGEHCDNTGEYFCNKDCTTVQMCSSKYTKVGILYCKEGKFCQKDATSDIDHKCGDDISSCRADSLDDVTCTSDGKYPSLTSCKKFITCERGIARQKDCDAGKKFDACTGDCEATLIIDDRICETNWHTPCDNTNIGESYPSHTNPSLYYTCGLNLATWKKCENGFIFSFHLQRCHSSGEICTSGATTPTSPPPGVNCYTIANHAIPGNNCLFYKCYGNGAGAYVKCKPNYSYDSDRWMCVAASGKCTG